MLISKLGEFGLIERFRKSIKTDASVIKGSGDDCAVLAFDKNRYQLFTCDMIIEGVDFTGKEKPRLIGRKALAIQVSDIAGCAGSPTHCLVSMGVSPNTTVEFIDELFKGMNDFAKKFKINIVGGDLSSSKKLIINVSMLGFVEKKNLLLRSGARINDIIFVTGSLGGSISGKHLNFTPRLRESGFLANNFKVNSMIDISDGLAQDLNHILEQSQKGAIIYEDLIPVAKKSNINEALYMGEDFELLFTMPGVEAKKLLRKKLKIFKPIGEIVEKNYGVNLVGKNGKLRPLFIKGFRHF
jgi:thiamine-monophosphate kinase